MTDEEARAELAALAGSAAAVNRAMNNTAASSTRAANLFEEATQQAVDDTEYDRIEALHFGQRLQPLRALASRGHARATLDVAALLEESDPHQAEWWLTRPHFGRAPEVAQSAASRLASLRASGRLRVVPPPADPAAIQQADTRDRPLEARLPALAQAMQRAGRDPGRLADAVQTLIDEHPDRPEPLLAQARLALGPLQARPLAESALERAERLAPLDRDLHVIRAQLETPSHPHRALARLQQISEHYPQSIEIAVMRADALARLKADDLAPEIDRLEKLLPLAETPPQKAQLHQRIAMLYGQLERWPLAEVNLNAAYAAAPDPQFLLLRGDARARQNKFLPALVDYQAALASPLSQNPQAAQALRQRISQLEARSATAQNAREQAARDAGVRASEEREAQAKASAGRILSGVEFDLGVRAHAAGDIEKAREFWTKAAAAGHEEAAARLKALPPPKS